MHRIYKRGGDHPTRWNELRYYGPTISRFDHHLLNEDGKPHTQSRGIVYLAGDIPTALAEVYQGNRTVDRKRDQPWLVSFELASDLTLLDLTDTFAVQTGASMKLISGARIHGQNWARGFYSIYGNIHGIFYLSSMTNRPVIALNERALEKTPFPLTPRFHRELKSPLLHIPIQEACADIGYQYT